jgi:hypothetical protein
MIALGIVRLNHDMVVRIAITRTGEIRESTTEIGIIEIISTIRSGNDRGIEDVTTESGITIGTRTGMGIGIEIGTLVATDAIPEDRTFSVRLVNDVQLGESCFYCRDTPLD